MLRRQGYQFEAMPNGPQEYVKVSEGQPGKLLPVLRELLLAAEIKSAAEVNDAMKAFAEFYDLYLIQGQTPGQILNQHAQWRNLWYDAPGGQYGRPAAFYQQLQALNLGEVWQNVDRPVLVIRGSKDTVMSRADSSAIAEMVNRAHPGKARYLEVEGMTHGFTVEKKFQAEMVTTILNCAKEQLADGKARPPSSQGSLPISD